MRFPSRLIGAAVFAFLAPAAPAQTMFTVTATTDSNPTGLGSGSGASGDLRYCIHQANALNLSGQTATINFSLPVNSTITLGSNILPPLNPAHNGQLGANSNSLLIDGSTATNLTIDGASSGYGIFMAYAGNIKIQNLTLANGHADGGLGQFNAGGGAGLGGGILVNDLARLTTQAVTFNNTAAFGGSSPHSVSNWGGGGGTNGGNGALGINYGGGGGLGGAGGSEGGGGVGLPVDQFLGRAVRRLAVALPLGRWQGQHPHLHRRPRAGQPGAARRRGACRLAMPTSGAASARQ